MRLAELPQIAPDGAAHGGRTDAAASSTPPRRVSLRLEGLARHFGAFAAVKGVSLDVEQGEFVTLLGPSGSGKTTTLMMIAGFMEPTTGRILVDGRDVTDDPPHRRNIGMVFQSYALFPHLSVFRNVAFPLEVRKRPAAEIRERTMQALEIVRLESFRDRYPAQLSGGQQQRVALARAIVFGPPILLMDEPLGALDKKLREHMQIELLKIQDRLGVTVIYVTHDQEEALVMSHRVVVMADGLIQQVGAPDELYRRPANRFVADFIGETNLLPAEVIEESPTPTVALSAGIVARTSSARVWRRGEKGFLVVRPECIRVGAASDSCAHHLRGKVERVIYVGDVSRVLITLDAGQMILAKLQNSTAMPSLRAGEEIVFGWESQAAWLVDDTTPGVN